MTFRGLGAVVAIAATMIGGCSDDGEPDASEATIAALPGVGEPFSNWTSDFRQITVEPGSEVRSAPSKSENGAMCSPQVTLEVTSPNPEAIAQAYVDQFLNGQLLPDVHESESVSEDAITTRFFVPPLAGADSFEVLLVTQENEPPVLLLQTCLG